MSDDELDKPVKLETVGQWRVRLARKWGKRAALAAAAPLLYFLAVGAEKDLRALWTDVTGEGAAKVAETEAQSDEPKSLVERMAESDGASSPGSDGSAERSLGGGGSRSGSETLAVNTAAGARVRAGPTSSSRPIATLALGREVRALGREGAWTRVRTPEGTGYVESRLLSSPDSVSSPAAGTSRSGNSFEVGDCKQYTSQIAMAGGQREVTGIACKQPDGTWQIKSRHVVGR